MSDSETDLPADHEPSVRPRPAWLRALGHDDPPARFDAGGHTWERVHIYKHDAFAATALYARADDANRKAVGKFSRRQSAFGVPFAWLGKWFHEREQEVYRRLADDPNVPATLGDIVVNGRVWPSAGARLYVEGHPLAEGERPHDSFFPDLEKLLARFHARRVAVVDLHKRDNIIVGDDGQPHLIDFQISLAASRGGLRFFDPRSWWLPSAVRADRYHLMKNWQRHRPDQLTPEQRDLDRYRPVSIRLWRKLIRPVHAARRRLFVALGFRTGKGDPETEVAPDVRPPAPGKLETPNPAPRKPASDSDPAEMPI
ncbi:MAG: hypothetical protein AAGH99_14430 [Planctomycetota bacterium]